ncbi:hypothetical protein ABZ807_28935 [Micromonospora sp. NPDC047548]|uniref:hypothetical protein n=1 Tax=Micromonospora sp. NPDC047548 TaxID=3155624 RepID=UPI00340B91C4
MIHPPHPPSTPTDLPARWRRRPAVRIAAALSVLCLLAAAALVPAWSATHTPAPDNSGWRVTPPARTSTAPCEIPAPLTAAQLRALAARTAATPPTALPAPQPAAHVLPRVAAEASCDVPGRFSFVQIRQWAADTRIDGGRTTSTVVVFEQRHWRADNGSGRAVNLRHPPGPQPTTDETYQPGELDGTIGPVAADPAGLTKQITSITQPFLGAPAVLDAVADLTAWRTPGRDARTAILALLNDTDGLTHHAAVRDRAGRTGVGVSATGEDGAVRGLFILHATTGEVLAYERAHFRPPKGNTRTGDVEDYLLFSVHTRTSTTNTP